MDTRGGSSEGEDEGEWATALESTPAAGPSPLYAADGGMATMGGGGESPGGEEGGEAEAADAGDVAYTEEGGDSRGGEEEEEE